MPPGENGPTLRRLSCPLSCGTSHPKAAGALREAAPLPFAEAGAGPAQEKTTLRLPPAKPSPGIEAAASDGDEGRSSVALLLAKRGLRQVSSAAAAVIFQRGAPGTASRHDTRTQPDRTMRQGSGSGCGSSMHACSGHCGSGCGVGDATAAGVEGAESASTAAAPAAGAGAGLLRAGVGVAAAAASTPRASTAAGDCDSRGSGGRRGDSVESSPVAADASWGGGDGSAAAAARASRIDAAAAEVSSADGSLELPMRRMRSRRSPRSAAAAPVSNAPTAAATAAAGDWGAAIIVGRVATAGAVLNAAPSSSPSLSVASATALRSAVSDCAVNEAAAAAAAAVDSAAASAC